MISEKWNSQFNIEYLTKHLELCVFNHEITRQSTVFGGWSVLSSNGSTSDGWQKGHKLIDPMVSETEKKIIESQIVKKFSEYTLETAICTGYLLEVINKVRDAGLTPFRARIICLPSMSSSSWHVDGAPSEYSVRLHVPIVTNVNCFFETRNEKEHLIADGSSYFIHVNREHRVYNFGESDRYHLVMNVVDTKNITNHHKYEDFTKSTPHK